MLSDALIAFIYTRYDLLLMAVASIPALFGAFIRKKYETASKAFFWSLATTTILIMSLSQPIIIGDGVEYCRMTESLYNHFTPDWREQDRRITDKLLVTFKPGGFLARGYFIARNSKSYSYHFWAYPLFNLPVKFVLRTFHQDEFKTLQITNAILLSLAIFFVVFIAKLSGFQKLTCCFLVTFSPALFYLRWTHPEFFSYSFVILSLIYLYRENWTAAILFSSIASLQNPPLLFLVIFLWAKAIFSSKFNLGRFALYSLAAGLSVLPFVFFYAHFHAYSLMVAVGTAGFRNLSLFKAADMLFDLNLGMLPFIPLLLLIYFAILARDIVLKRRFSLNLQLFLVMIVMMLMCTTNRDWNHGASGPSRYVIWMLPIVIFAVVTEESLQHIGGAPKYGFALIVWIAAAFQAILLFSYGGIEPAQRLYLYHTPVAEYVLKKIPCLYNPTPEIFIERTLHQDFIQATVLPYPYPVAYRYESKCKKALARGKDKEKLVALCGYIPERYSGFFGRKENEEKSIYVNY